MAADLDEGQHRLPEVLLLFGDSARCGRALPPRFHAKVESKGGVSTPGGDGAI